MYNILKSKYIVKFINLNKPHLDRANLQRAHLGTKCEVFTEVVQVPRRKSSYLQYTVISCHDTPVSWVVELGYHYRSSLF